MIDAAEAGDEAGEAGEPEAGPVAARRKAWTPGAEEATATVLRRLARHPWLVAGRDDDAIAAVRQNEAALRSALARLGWILVVERGLVRLRKSPPPRPVAWAVDGPPPLVCSWYFLLVAAAESMAPRVGLGQLVTAARAAGAEAGLPGTGDMRERRAIVGALRELDQRGVVEAIDGEVEAYVRDEDAPVLLAVHHTRLAQVVANSGRIDPAADPGGWLEQVQREPDPARRMRRRLVDDTCVHAVDLDPAEAQWLSQRVRGDDGAPLAAAFGLALERRSEGAAFVVPDEAFRHPRDLGPLPFPTAGTVTHAALLLCDHAAAHGRLDEGPGVGWRTLDPDEVLSLLTRLAGDSTAGRGGWKAELASDPAQLSEEVGRLLEGLNLLQRTTTGDWHFAPATGRWARPGTAPRRARAFRTTTATTAAADELPELDGAP